jgi:hypothetical protein
MNFPSVGVRSVRIFLAGLVAAVTGAGLLAASGALVPAVAVKLGPEELVSKDMGWPYLFQAAEGTTVVLGLRHWIPKQPEPVVLTVRSFDGRQTWSPWMPSPAQGPGPVTEGSVVQLKDGRILVFNVYAYHVGGRVFEGKRWVSRDGWKTLSGPEPIRVTLSQAKVDGMVDDRGEPISRLYLRRSVIALPGGDLLATGYGRFEGDDLPVDYIPAMKQSRTYLIRSKDEGLTWTDAGTVALPPCGQEGFGEPVLVQLKHGRPAGRLICQMRTGRENAVFQAESDDEGKTWTPAHALSWTFSRSGHQREIIGVDPDLIEMSDGTLVMSYGHKPDFMDDGNFLAFSTDQGATWGSVKRVSTQLTIAYTGVREVAPGELYVIYTRTDETDPAKYQTTLFETYGRKVTVGRN